MHGVRLLLTSRRRCLALWMDRFSQIPIATTTTSARFAAIPHLHMAKAPG